MTQRNIKHPFLIYTLFVAIVIASFFVGKQLAGKPTVNSQTKCDRDYEYINIALTCGGKPIITKVGYATLQDKINDYIETEKQAGTLTNASVYFRDLKEGPIFGINETDEFAPASLLKLPVALAYLYNAQTLPELLNQRLGYNSTIPQVQQEFKPAKEIQSGQSYSIKELIEYMIKYSDNKAYSVLDGYLEQSGNKDMLNQTYMDLGLVSPDNLDDTTLTTRRYGSIFRALYNTAYLSPELSEDLMSWLASSDFNEGLTKELPKSLVVAHKFGERESEDGLSQLHDCGIVYYPENPYLLCIMTKGSSMAKLSPIIAEVSKMVYEEVDSRKIQ